MTQKPSNKRAKQPRQVAYTPTFKESWERYNRAGRRDMNAAVLVMEILFSQKIIPKEYLDHELEGHEWQGARSFILVVISYWFIACQIKVI